MKTAISIPDDVFAQAEEQATALSMSRSDFFTRAARHYLERLEAESLTGRVNAALDLAGVDDSASEAVYVGHRLLASSEDEW